MAKRAQSARSGEVALGYYLDILRRRIWIVAAVSMVVTTLGALRIFRAPAVYEATAKVLVERQSSRVMKFDGVMQDYSGWDPDFYSTQASLLRSRVVMEIAVADPSIAKIFAEPVVSAGPPEKTSFFSELRNSVRLLVGGEPSAPPAPWETLRARVRADVEPDTHFLRVRVSDSNPGQAALIANAAARAYATYHSGQHAELLGDAFAYLKREQEKQTALLSQAEQALQEFREQAQGLSLSVDEAFRPEEERLNALNGQITSVQLARSKLKAENEVLGSVVERLQKDPDSLSDDLRSLPIRAEGSASAQSSRRAAVVARLEALVKAESELTRLEETYGSEHPRLKTARSEVQLLRNQFGAALRQTLKAHESELAVMEKEESELQRRYEEERKVALQLANETFTFTHLKSAVDRHRALYEALVQRMLEVDVTSGFSKTSVQVVEEAEPPKSPVNRRRMQGLLMFLAIGFLGGAGLALFFENLDDSVKTPEDLKERLDVPLLGFVPRVPRANDAAEAEDTPRVVLLAEPMSSAAEAYRNVRTSLLYSSPARELKSIAMVSCSPEEGKTTTAVNLAIAMAQSGKTVLLIDCDLHRPNVHRMLRIELEPGLTNALVGEADWRAACRTLHYEGAPVANLKVLPAGTASPNPAELLSAQRMKDLLAEARLAYDWVVVDTPPVLFVSDSCVVSAECDGVVWVVKAGAVHRSLLNRAREQLDNVRAHIVGAVLNSVAVTRVGRHYSRYYYHGYSRYARDYHRTYYNSGRKSKDDKAPA